MNESKTRLLIVDDEQCNTRMLTRVLHKDFHISSAQSGTQALEQLNNGCMPDLILLDVMMPRMDGFEVCHRLKSNPKTSDIPVIFVTAMNDNHCETRALGIGAVDFICKPFSPATVRARVSTHVSLQQAKKALAKQNEQLQMKVRERTMELELTQEATILAMAALAETRDDETGNHLHRTKCYVKVLAQQLVKLGSYTNQLTKPVIEALYKSALLHDIGKVGLPDRILKKPGRLDESELVEMKLHTIYGRDAINAVEKKLSDSHSSFLKFAWEITYSHHEKWDGSGYPQGLVGETIPLSARIMALSDVYDALISKRVYKPAFSHQEACAIIMEGKGSHFDPLMVEAFAQCSEKFHRISLQYSDH